MGVQFEAHSVVTCAALYKAFTFCKQEMNRYLAQLEKGQVRASNDQSVGRSDKSTINATSLTFSFAFTPRPAGEEIKIESKKK